MKRTLLIIIGGVLVGALLARTITYTVRFTEAAVLTTFGKAGEGSIKTEPGLKLKWPDPIQSVTTYDTRVRFLQARMEAQQTADSKQIVVEAFCTWRVSDPLQFFKRFSNAGDKASSHYEKAAEVLKGNLRSAMSETARFRLDELFAPQSGKGKLADLEARILADLAATDQSGQKLSDYGLEVVDVGISRIVLPEETSRAVFEHMKADRATLVKSMESSGAAQAQAIRVRAETSAKKIVDFANSRAAEIKAEGDKEATRFVKQMEANPELAVFLKNIEFIRDLTAKQITLLFSTDSPGFGLFSPKAVKQTPPGKIPGTAAFTDPAFTAQPAQAEATEPKPAPGGHR